MKSPLKVVLLSLVIILLNACTMNDSLSDSSKSTTPSDNNINETLETAYFSGGCFWCSEADFEKHDGVKEVISGFLGGTKENPSYKEVASGSTNHREGVEVLYNPKKISYEELLDIFWKHIDPTDPGGQFVDRGSQYSSAIFYKNNIEKAIAEKSKSQLQKSQRYIKDIITPILPASTFYQAEEYHQDYYKKNPLRYKFYRNSSGRDQYIDKKWRIKDPKTTTYVKPNQQTLKKELTAIQYHITQENGTEKAYSNDYWDNKKEGIYVDILSGEALFSSTDKYDSKTGWPSFSKPIAENTVQEKEDNILFIKRTEIRSIISDSHLGHVFPDGPKPTGLRYCINSAALKFIPKQDLIQNGYEKYLNLF
jgi:peptide methionine sulfoxide reductase msrA/msrB